MDDFDRLLSLRGVQEAKAMVVRLRELHLTPDLLISSTAERTRQTAEIAIRALEPKSVQPDARLYLAAPDVMLEIVRSVDPDVKHLMIVGHNPGISELATQLAPDDAPDSMATASAYTMTFDADDWASIFPGTAIDARYHETRAR